MNFEGKIDLSEILLSKNRVGESSFLKILILKK